MARTTATLVRGIVETDATISLTPFIETATSLVTSVCGAAGYTDAVLELIERWLAGHFYCTRDQRRSYESARSVMEGFQWKVGLGLGLSPAGQQVMLLDHKGLFAALNAKITNPKAVPSSIKLVAGHGEHGTHRTDC